MYFKGSNRKPLRGSNRSQRWLALFCLGSIAVGSLGINAISRFNGTYAIHGARCAVVSYQVTIVRPLVSLDVVSSVLNVSREDGRMLIDNGSLFAFNLSLKQSRSLIRVFSHSLAEYARSRTAPKAAPEFSAVLGAAFPGQGKTIRASQVVRAFSCDNDHVLNLIRAGAFRLANGEQIKTGCNGSPLLEFASVTEFMERGVIA